MTSGANTAPQAAAIFRDGIQFSEAFARAASPTPEPGSQAEQERYHYSEAGADGKPWTSKSAGLPYDLARELM